MGVVRMTAKERKKKRGERSFAEHTCQETQCPVPWRENKNCAGQLVSCECYKLNSTFPSHLL